MPIVSLVSKGTSSLATVVLRRENGAHSLGFKYNQSIAALIRNVSLQNINETGNERLFYLFQCPWELQSLQRVQQSQRISPQGRQEQMQVQNTY